MDKAIPTESLLQFYERRGLEIPADLLNNTSGNGHFNIRLNKAPTLKTPFNRRDYFKVCLSSGTGKSTGILLYNDQEILLNEPCLIFTNPSVPVSIEIAGAMDRHFCLFNKQFIDGHIAPDIQYACALFNASLFPVIRLTKNELRRLTIYFDEMQLLLETDYPFKWDMIRNILQLLMHEGIRLQQQQSPQPAFVRDRLLNSFFTQLGAQFPVDSPENSLKLLTPAHFADLLHIHVNHLNSVVKKHTGKTTSTIIHERMIAEAKALLKNTNWNIAEIAYALGFEYPSHFNKFFKQYSAITPLQFRAGAKPILVPHL